MPASLTDPNAHNPILSFDNTEIAFRGKTNRELNRAYWLFKIIGSRLLNKIGLPAANFAINIGLPVQGLIKSTIFAHFCGGESIEECGLTIEKLARGKVGTILDYSVEGVEEEKVFTQTAEEIIRTIRRASGDTRIPLTVFKITGLGRFDLLARLNAVAPQNLSEQAEFVRLKARVDMICRAAHDADVPVMIDAEESWIQGTIDKVAMEMMRRYNREKCVVYHTYQLYRIDKLALLQADVAFAVSSGFVIGVKLVRGAYMEKERARAAEHGYPTPIQPDKTATDRDYNAALAICIESMAHVALVAGTHNENSCQALVNLMEKYSIAPGNPNVCFSQLLGMGDNLSFNLADAGYNVAKYVPYGPVKAVIPYLIRRAQENKSISGHTGRELALIMKEKRRRRV